jgi:hypothetical protein
MSRFAETLENGLLVGGLLFPSISAVTLFLAGFTRLQTGRRPSAILIPVVGPTLLSLWVLLTGHHWGWIPAVWLADPATWYLLRFLIGRHSVPATGSAVTEARSADLADKHGGAIIRNTPDPDAD